MAGGLFGRPFTINIKCVIFSILCMALFLYKPNFTSEILKYLTLFIIFVVAYVAMAWYDFYFDCRVLPLERENTVLQGFLNLLKMMKKKKIQMKRVLKRKILKRYQD